MSLTPKRESLLLFCISNMYPILKLLTLAKHYKRIISSANKGSLFLYSMFFQPWDFSEDEDLSDSEEHRSIKPVLKNPVKNSENSSLKNGVLLLDIPFFIRFAAAR